MLVIITILLFTAFITYGVSEHVLVVSLHNIRVLVSRMCNGIAKLFAKKQSNNDVDEDDINKPQKKQLEFRSYKKEEEHSREKRLLEQVRELEQENAELQQQGRELTTQYKSQLSSLANKVAAYEKKIETVCTENDVLKQRLGGLQPIDKLSVAMPFCDEYEQIKAITNKFIGRLVLEFERFSAKQKGTCGTSVLDFVYDKLDDDNNTIIKWYAFLKDTAFIPKELSYDLVSKNDERSQLEYLQKYASEKFYRPQIASAMLLAEKIRLAAPTHKQNEAILNMIQGFVESLLAYGIEVDYIPTNSILTDSEFSKYEVESVSITEEEENKVIEVRRYAVNRPCVLAEPEKAILVINI